MPDVTFSELSGSLLLKGEILGTFSQILLWKGSMCDG